MSKFCGKNGDKNREKNDINHKFKKQFGQNFLSDGELLESIVDDAGVSKEDTVLEIGAGAGALTKRLAERAKRVVCFEIDKELQPILTAALSGFDNVEVVFADFMKQNLAELEDKLGDGYVVAANLPYYVSSPVVMLFAEQAKKIKRLTLTLQKEVGERLAASAGSSEYGAVTVALDAVADVKTTRFIDRTMFYPVPNVDSVVVRADFAGNKYGIKNFKNFRRVVKAAFAQRRKTFVNNLICEFNVDRTTAENWLKRNGVDVLARGETLSAKTFAALSDDLDALLT